MASKTFPASQPRHEVNSDRGKSRVSPCYCCDVVVFYFGWSGLLLLLLIVGLSLNAIFVKLLWFVILVGGGS